MTLCKVRRWIRLFNEALATLILLATLMIMFRIYWGLSQQPDPYEIQEEIRKSRKR